MKNIENFFNQQLLKITPSPIRQFDEDVSAIDGIIKLTLGEPDFNTPKHVKKAGIQAINDNFSHYTGMSGLPELRENVAAFFKEKYDISYDPTTEILTTVGATEAIAASLLGILNPGEKVLIPTPAFPGYEPVVIMAGAEPVYINTSSNDFVLSPQMIDDAMAEHGDKVKAIVLNYPSNPTGVTYTQEEVKEIADTLGKYELFVLSDEIYSELTYEHTHFSIAKYLPEQTILINGLSKSHAMTGWRIGFILTSAPIAKQLAKSHQFIVTAATTISQKAAINALTEGKDDGVEMKKEYVLRRNFVYEKMTALGFEIAPPSGAFYIFAKIPTQCLQDSMSFCVDVAHKAKVAFVPGDAFGPGGEHYVRVSYAASMDALHEAMSRLEAYVKKSQ